MPRAGQTNSFRKLSIVKKSAYNKKYVSRRGLQIIFGTSCEILHIGWNKRKKPWFSWGFHGVYHENRLVGNLHYYICNQRVEIRKYGELEGNQRINLFRTAPPSLCSGINLHTRKNFFLPSCTKYYYHL